MTHDEWLYSVGSANSGALPEPVVSDRPNSPHTADPGSKPGERVSLVPPLRLRVRGALTFSLFEECLFSWRAWHALFSALAEVSGVERILYAAALGAVGVKHVAAEFAKNRGDCSFSGGDSARQSNAQHQGLAATAPGAVNDTA